MGKKKQEIALTNDLQGTVDVQVDENLLFASVAEIIETRKTRAGAYANCEVTLMYWEIGCYFYCINCG